MQHFLILVECHIEKKMFSGAAIFNEELNIDLLQSKIAESLNGPVRDKILLVSGTVRRNISISAYRYV